MKHIKMFHAALATFAITLAGGYAFAEDAPEVEETPVVTKVKSLKPKYTSIMTIEGYSGETELENFPVPVRISTANIPGFDYSKCDGEGDITFTDDEGNILPHEVEVWNTEGESVAWVSVPKLSTVVAEDTTTYTTFKMHWGHETKLVDTKATEVWTAANYVGVWHMNDIYNPEGSSQYDATGNGNTATYITNLSDSGTSSDGIIGNTFYNGSGRDGNDGSTACVTTKNLTDNIKVDWNGCTISGWSRWCDFDATSGSKWLYYIGTSSSGSYAWGIQVVEKVVKAKFGNKTACSLTTQSASSGLSPKNWFNWAVRVSNKSSYDYFLNSEKASCTLPSAASTMKKYSSQSTTSSWYCGGVKGYIDEYRIRNAISSDDWIKAEYDSINNKQFVVASEAVKNSNGLKIIVR